MASAAFPSVMLTGCWDGAGRAGHLRSDSGLHVRGRHPEAGGTQEPRSVGGRPGCLELGVLGITYSFTARFPASSFGQVAPPPHLPRVTPSHPASLWRGQEGVWRGGAAGMSLHVLVGKAVRSWCGRNSREGPRDGAACAGLICGTVVAHSSQKGEQLCRGPASLQDSERPCTPPPNTSHHVTGMTEGQPRRPGHALPLTDPCGLHSSSSQHSPQGDAGGQPLEASREARGQRAALGLRSQSVQVAACVAPARLLASALGRL